MFLVSFFAFLLSFFYFMNKRNKPSGYLSFDLPSNKPPAVVGHIVNSFNVVTLHEFIATLVDLAYRKKLILRVVENNKIELRKQDLSGLSDFEKQAIDIIMKKDDHVILEDEVDRVKSSKDGVRKFNDEFEQWKETVNRHCEQYHSGINLDGEVLLDNVKALALGTVLAAIAYSSLFLLNLSTLAEFLDDLAVGFMLAVIISVIYQAATGIDDLKKSAREEKKKWLRLKSVIDKYTWIKEKPPTEHVIWDRIMVYAIVLNSTENVYQIAREFLALKKIQEYVEAIKAFDDIYRLPVEAAGYVSKTILNSMKIYAIHK